MKLRVYLPLLLVGLLWSSMISAQDKEGYGDDPQQCKIKLSTYTEFFNQKNYTDAMDAWRWCFTNCPASTKNIYIHGTTIIEYYINEQTDDAVREIYIDTLLMVYDNRIKHFNQEGLVLGRKGLSLLKYRPNEIQQAYDIFEKSYTLSGDKTEYFALKYYMNTAVILFGSEKLTKEQILEIYSNVSDAINVQINNYEIAGKAKKKAKCEKTAIEIEQLFVNSGAADCTAIINLFGPKFEKNPTDLDLAKKIISLLDRGKSDECQLSDLYMNTAVVVYTAEATSTSAHSIAQSYFKRGENENAEKYYNEAIALEEDNLKKADMYYELGLLYYSNFKNYPKARTAARGAIASDPEYGKAYMLIGRIYAAGGRCGKTAFEKKSLNWLIVDQFVRAKSIDPSLAPEANQLIGRYSASFPTQEEGFWIDVLEGQKVTIGCWVNETTTVRFIK